MNRFCSPLHTHRPVWSSVVAGALLSLSLSAAMAQQSQIPITESPNQGMTRGDAAAPTPQQEAQTTSGRNSAVTVIEQGRDASVNNAIGPRGSAVSVRDGLITEVGSGRPVGEGNRVLRLPGQCTPKTNSLDCVADASQGARGENVSSRVRNSVIGEVGAGKAATEGGGKAKGQVACTPQAGKLTCE